MRKRDILTPIGITLGFIMIMLAIMSKGGTAGASLFLDISSIFIVIGGLIASMLINFKMEQIKLTNKIISEAFHKNDLKLPELISLFIRLSERARREGLLALENELEEVEDPFIRKGILLAVDGIEPEVIKDIMNAEITAMEDRHYRGRTLVEKAGEYAPAWGMIGTLVGLVLMLNNLQDPTALGPSMAVALLTTLYGTVLANLVFVPMASKLETKTEEEVFIKQIIIEGVIGVQSGQNPRILEEKLSAFLPNDVKDKQEEQEDAGFVGEKINEA
ncbi:flagellar motor protein MotP [Virgibacillus halodenitrificans]|jgi:chemotaxis protein MotA|uniref:flagellar motor protein MotP n=1 Tax=Virgibacillus halodenitrificans TaxID=1482 RepID=UPI00136BDA82|nr:flagellar motor protein MotP [Virgibacillus halodenitrificans]MCG1027762.1 flagellar motor protein MotP [Virgibacillus halodenitrificans]MYL44763.1 flagellar motor protein MotP [Virgibacillus halodenitrificans]MYL57338.1 flagellar motor protein MotP [Virgibacillus halodenitrificans]